MFLRIQKFLKNEEGATAVEYAVMLALIIGALIGSVNLVGQKAVINFTKSGTELTSTLGL